MVCRSLAAMRHAPGACLVLTLLVAVLMTIGIALSLVLYSHVRTVPGVYMGGGRCSLAVAAGVAPACWRVNWDTPPSCHHACSLSPRAPLLP